MKRVNPAFGADVDVGERLRRQRDHAARAFLEAAHLARRVAERPAHLPGQLQRDRVAIGDECIDERSHQARPLGERASAPVALRSNGTRERGGDLRIGGLSPFGIDRPSTGLIVLKAAMWKGSDDLEVARQFPVGDVLAELALFPLARRGEMVDERVAERARVPRMTP